MTCAVSIIPSPKFQENGANWNVYSPLCHVIFKWGTVEARRWGFHSAVADITMLLLKPTLTAVLPLYCSQEAAGVVREEGYLTEACLSHLAIGGHVYHYITFIYYQYFVAR